MLKTLRTYLAKLTKTLLIKLDPTYEQAVQIHTTPPNALTHLVASIDRKYGNQWDANTLPSDTMETVMYRAGAKGYRMQLMKELHATSAKGLLP